MATVVFPEIATANNAITTLDGAISDSATTLQLPAGGVAGLGFSNSTTDGYVTVIDATTWRKNPLTTPETLEVMAVTAANTTTDELTVTRGADGTSALAFPDGSIVELRINAAMIQRIYDALTDGSDDINVGAVTAAGSVKANNGTVNVGVADTTGGRVDVYGDNNATGGLLYIHNSLNEKGTVSSYVFHANNAVLNMGTNLDSNALQLDASTGDFKVTAGGVDVTDVYNVDGTQVVSNRVTGWAAPTGTATRTTFATSTVTLEQLAERVHALIDDLTTHGLIGS